MELKNNIKVIKKFNFIFIKIMVYSIINCPYCNASIIIEKLNCRIFRHGYYTKNNKQIGPHLLEKTVDVLIKNKKIYPLCGKQFKINKDKSIIKTTGL